MPPPPLHLTLSPLPLQWSFSILMGEMRSSTSAADSIYYCQGLELSLHSSQKPLIPLQALVYSPAHMLLPPIFKKPDTLSDFLPIPFSVKNNGTCCCPPHLQWLVWSISIWFPLTVLLTLTHNLLWLQSMMSQQSSTIDGSNSSIRRVKWIKENIIIM